MSFSALINKKNVSTGFNPIQFQPTGFGDIVSASYNFTRTNYNFDASFAARKEVSVENRQQFQDKYGETYRDFIEEPTPTQKRQFARSSEAKSRYIDEQIMKARERDPKYADYFTQAELREKAKERAISYGAKYEETVAGAQGGTLAADLLGSIGAAFTDPVNLGTAFVGAGRTLASTSFRVILRAALTDGLINAGVEAAGQPVIADWQKELGREYGLGDMARMVAASFVFGTAFSGTIRSTAPLASKALSKVSTTESLPLSVRQAARRLIPETYLREQNISRYASQADEARHLESLDNALDDFEKGGRVSSERVTVSDLDIIPEDLSFISRLIQDFGETAPTDRQLINALSNSIDKRFQDIKTDIDIGQVKRLTDEIESLKTQAKTNGAQKRFDEAKSSILNENPRAQFDDPMNFRNTVLNTLNDQDSKLLRSIQKMESQRARYNKIYKAKLDYESFKKGVVPQRYKKTFDSIRSSLDSERKNAIQSEINPNAQNRISETEQIISERVSRESIDNYDEFYAQSRSDEFFDSIDAQFQEISRSNPSGKILDDNGNEISLSGLSKEFEADEAVLAAMRSCAI